jgi:flagellar basal body-associated protein FliL
MKIKQKSLKKTVWIPTIIIAAVFAGVLLTYFVLSKDGNFASPSKTSDKSIPADEQQGDIENTTNTPDKTTSPNSDQPAENEIDESSGKRLIPVVASVNVDGSQIYIRGGVNTPETDGTCYAELIGPNSQKIRKDTTLLPSVSTTDCKTIIIPTSELSAGKWSFTLNFTSNSAKGGSSADTFVIN